MLAVIHQVLYSVFFMTTPISNKRPLDYPSFPSPKKQCKMGSLPQFIQAMNACLDQKIDTIYKIPKLKDLVRGFTVPSAVERCNPFYGAQLLQIAQTCLNIEPENAEFIHLKNIAETMKMPVDIVREILKHFACKQPWKTIIRRIDNQEGSSLLGRIGCVSKLWRQTLLSVFCAKMSAYRLAQLEIETGEGVIRFATLCCGQFVALSLENVSLTVDQFSQLLPLIPRLRKLHLNGFFHSESLNQIVQSDHMSHLEKLTISNGEDSLAEKMWVVLKQKNQWKSLKALNINNIYLKTPNNLFQLPWLIQLKYINLDGSIFRDGGVGLLNTTIALPYLEKFSLDTCNLSDLSFLKHVAAPRLQVLDLSRNLFAAEQVTVLAQCSFAPSVTWLAISLPGKLRIDTRIIDPSLITTILDGFINLLDFEIEADDDIGILDEPGVAVIAKHPHAAQLQHLSLASSLVRDTGASHLFHSPYLTNLQNLNVADSNIGLSGFRALETSKMNLKTLILDNMEFDRVEFMDILTSASSTAKLEWLCLNGSVLCACSQTKLAKTSHFIHLKKLFLVETVFADDALLSLANNPHYAQLEVLDLIENDINYNTFIEIAESTSLKNLNSLYVSFDDETTEIKLRKEINEILFRKHNPLFFPDREMAMDLDKVSRLK